jgi:hypothetical protein
LAQQGSAVVGLSVVTTVDTAVDTVFTAVPVPTTPEAPGAGVAMFEGVVVAAMCIETTRWRDNS